MDEDKDDLPAAESGDNIEHSRDSFTFAFDPETLYRHLDLHYQLYYLT